MDSSSTHETLFFTAAVLLCVQNKCFVFFVEKKPDWFDQIEIKKKEMKLTLLSADLSARVRVRDRISL